MDIAYLSFNLSNQQGDQDFHSILFLPDTFAEFSYFWVLICLKSYLDINMSLYHFLPFFSIDPASVFQGAFSSLSSGCFPSVVSGYLLSLIFRTTLLLSGVPHCLLRLQNKGTGLFYCKYLLTCHMCYEHFYGRYFIISILSRPSTSFNKYSLI